LQRATIDIMREEVRAIFRAVTGTDMPEPVVPASAPAPAEDEVTRSFADLEAAARLIPEVQERVPPFSFTPPLDVFEDKETLVFTLAVPGIDRDDVSVELRGDVLLISGVRRGEPVWNGHAQLHAEIPRGPFQRSVRLATPVAADLKVEIDRGLVRIQLSKKPAAPPAAGGN
jgi:HSP20 family molecular chaperone IbpA